MSQVGEKVEAGGVQRRRKKAATETEAKKRRLSDEQSQGLEMSFGAERKLETARKLRIASELGLEPKQVAVWFQNRRTRWKGKQLEEAFRHLRAAYDTVVSDKCRLESEVSKLKERISEAQGEISKLAAPGSQMSGGSPCSSLSVDTDWPFLDELGFAGDAHFTCIFDYSYDNYMMEWVNPNGL